MASKVAKAVAQQGSFKQTLRKWVYNTMGFRQYGLWHDDCLYETGDVKEALRRLPTRLLDERQFRQQRAMQLSVCKEVLPKEQWTKFEDDIRYLTPYLEEVLREKKEKEEWEQK
ncbi:cytochrome b-c1 complex subunit 7-like [Artemia franciscana]|uniref:Cytochrome b-c1 complex subunit 7 n=1 Tax=Artemia franciscana TaxID=6661 RepID=A0AA88LDB5_ARTSF|nr:hypothetical protein QYM36_006199 [Artemia franciscana]